MIRKLRIKFVCINMTIVAIMLAAVFLVLFLSTGHTLEMESVDLMQTIARDPMRRHVPQKRDKEVRRPYIAVRIGKDGEVEESFGSYFDLTDEAQLREIIRSAQEHPKDRGTLPEYNLRFTKNGARHGDWMVFLDTTNEQSALRNLMGNCVWIGGAAFLVFLGVSIFLARWAVRPVDEAWKQQKQFIADASHELKTPLTVIMTNADFLVENEYDDAEKLRFSYAIIGMCRQMKGLVENMLELARADNGTLNAERGKLDLSAALSDAVLPFEPIFFERGITLESDIEQNVCIHGNADQMRQLSEILLDNAQKYASENGSARVGLKLYGHRKCLLTVSDTGDPIPEKERKNIFKRFYRLDRARSMNQSYGLGLSIAQSIVSAHGGRIWADSKDGWNTFFVELPTANRE